MVFGFWRDNVRPVLQKYPGIVLGVMGAAAIASVAFGFRSCASDGPPIVTPSSYYTCDDGKTLFEDNSAHVAPFDHDGREAVQAFFVPGKTVGRPDSIWYLSKMTDEHKKQLEATTASGPPAAPKAQAKPGPAAKSPSPMSGQLVKRPGDTDWVPMGDPRSTEILKLPE